MLTKRVARNFSLNLFSHKIKVKGPLVELEGDEMAQVLWTNVKQNVSTENSKIKHSCKVDYAICGLKVAHC